MTPIKTKAVIEIKNKEEETFSNLGINIPKDKEFKEVIRYVDFGFILEDVEMCRASIDEEGHPENYTVIVIQGDSICIQEVFDDFYNKWAYAKNNANK